MKHGKKPTKKQKIMMKIRGLDPNNWLIERENEDHFVIKKRNSNRTRKMYKEVS